MKMIMEMMKQMKTEMNQRFDGVNKENQEVIVELQELKVEMNRRFETVENKLDGIGQQVREVRIIQDFHKTKIADLEEEVSLLKMKQKSNKEQHDSISYLTHKVREHDMAIHALRNKQ